MSERPLDAALLSQQLGAELRSRPMRVERIRVIGSLDRRVARKGTFRNPVRDRKTRHRSTKERSEPTFPPGDGRVDRRGRKNEQVG